MSGRVLLIEDEDLVGTMVQLNLQSEGYEVEWIRDGREGLARAESEDFALILLDIALPGLSGIEILRELRRQGRETPVLMLTARAEVAAKVEAFDIGTDDYLTKPFDLSELCARVRALTRRRTQAR